VGILLVNHCTNDERNTVSCTPVSCAPVSCTTGACTTVEERRFQRRVKRAERLRASAPVGR
jgi:hypothetical protein